MKRVATATIAAMVTFSTPALACFPWSAPGCQVRELQSRIDELEMREATRPQDRHDDAGARALAAIIMEQQRRQDAEAREQAIARFSAEHNVVVREARMAACRHLFDGHVQGGAYDLCLNQKIGARFTDPTAASLSCVGRTAAEARVACWFPAAAIPQTPSARDVAKGDWTELQARCAGLRGKEEEACFERGIQ